MEGHRANRSENGNNKKETKKKQKKHSPVSSESRLFHSITSHRITYYPLTHTHRHIHIHIHIHIHGNWDTDTEGTATLGLPNNTLTRTQLSKHTHAHTTQPHLYAHTHHTLVLRSPILLFFFSARLVGSKASGDSSVSCLGSCVYRVCACVWVSV